MAWLFSKKLMDSASLPYSQEQVAESSAENSSDGEQCALWNGTHMQRASWLPVKMTDACRLSRSGMTFKPLTDDLGEAALMSFLEAFPVRTSQQQEKGPALRESAAVCGDTWRELSVKFDRNTSSWKTHLCLWDEDLPESSVTLPKWGMMRDGVLWERTTLPPRTSGTESGLWPTPRVGGEEGYETVKTRKGHRAAIQHKLLAAVQHSQMFPTPSANEDAAGTPNGKMQRMLGNCKEVRGETEKEWAGGTLNPTWVEKLMGWPAQWTNLNPIIDLEHISWIMGFCECEEIRAKEVLRMLRKTDQAKAFQQKTGRPINLQEAQVLLSIMCEHQVSSDQAWILMESEEAPKKQVRVMRVGSKTSSASHRSDHKQQPPREHSDALQTLPRFLAHHGQEAWEKGSWEDAIPRVTHHKASRVDRLKAIGNGQVPAVAALAWEILSEK